MKRPAESHPIAVEVNGEPQQELVESSQLLVHFLRETLGLTGTHIGCDSGNCGACTVLVDGEAVKSCMVLAVQVDGCQVETVESLADPDEPLTELQQAFSDQHALQCGWCTPGMLMGAKALLARDPEPDRETIRRALKGNICRCTGYVNIVRAIEQAAAGAAGKGTPG